MICQGREKRIEKAACIHRRCQVSLLGSLWTSICSGRLVHANALPHSLYSLLRPRCSHKLQPAHSKPMEKTCKSVLESATCPSARVGKRAVHAGKRAKSAAYAGAQSLRLLAAPCKPASAPERALVLTQSLLLLAELPNRSCCWLLLAVSRVGGSSNVLT